MNSDNSQDFYEQRHQEFFTPLSQVVTELRTIFEKFDLSQQQAACVAACALNQITNVSNGFPKIVTVSLISALNLKDN